MLEVQISNRSNVFVATEPGSESICCEPFPVGAVVGGVLGGVALIAIIVVVTYCLCKKYRVENLDSADPNATNQVQEGNTRE